MSFIKSTLVKLYCEKRQIKPSECANGFRWLVLSGITMQLETLKE